MAQVTAVHPALRWGHWQVGGDVLNCFLNTSMEHALQTPRLFCSPPTWCFIIRNSCMNPSPRLKLLRNSSAPAAHSSPEISSDCEEDYD